MKNKLTFSILFIIIIVYLLLHPEMVFLSASRGLLLWFHTLLPTLLPFLILTSIVNEILPRNHHFIRIFVMMSGILCGFPLGAKLCSEAACSEKLTKKEAQYLLPLCNLASPSFIITYILYKTMHITEELYLWIGVIYLPVVITAVLTRPYYGAFPHVTQEEKTTPGKSFSLSLLDESIMNGFEVLTKLGGYIILFSILSEAMKSSSFIGQGAAAILSVLFEITTGSQLLMEQIPQKETLARLLIPAVQFGGLSFLLQTKSMIQKSGLQILPYIITKAIISCMTALFTYLLTI